MSRTLLAPLSHWSRRGALAGLVVALALPLLAFLAAAGWGREVLLIAPHDPSVVELNRSLWSPGDPVAEIYGSPMSAPPRVLIFGNRGVLHPEEDPSIALLHATTEGSRPFQVQTLWWAVRLAELGVGGAVAFLLAVSAFAGRRARPRAAPAQV